MFDITREEIEWGGRTLTLETGRVARQADGAVLATYGETSVLATVVADRSPKPGLDFFPLTVNYQEKAYAAGKVPGGYFKREGRPSEKETLVSRLIDRPIRPLFVKGFKNETQVIATVVKLLYEVKFFPQNFCYQIVQIQHKYFLFELLRLYYQLTAQSFLYKLCNRTQLN